MVVLFSLIGLIKYLLKVCALIGGRENRNSTKNGITDFMGCILKVSINNDLAIMTTCSKTPATALV